MHTISLKREAQTFSIFIYVSTGLITRNNTVCIYRTKHNSLVCYARLPANWYGSIKFCAEVVFGINDRYLNGAKKFRVGTVFKNVP